MRSCLQLIDHVLQLLDGLSVAFELMRDEIAVEVKCEEQEQTYHRDEDYASCKNTMLPEFSPGFSRKNVL